MNYTQGTFRIDGKLAQAVTNWENANKAKLASFRMKKSGDYKQVWYGNEMERVEVLPTVN